MMKLSFAAIRAAASVSTWGHFTDGQIALSAFAKWSPDARLWTAVAMDAVASAAAMPLLHRRRLRLRPLASRRPPRHRSASRRPPRHQSASLRQSRRIPPVHASVVGDREDARSQGWIAVASELSAKWPDADAARACLSSSAVIENERKPRMFWEAWTGTTSYGSYYQIHCRIDDARVLWVSWRMNLEMVRLL